MLWLLGYPEQASEWQDAAFALASELRHPETLVEALESGMQLSTFNRDGRTARLKAEAVLQIATAIKPLGQFRFESIHSNLNCPDCSGAVIRREAGESLRGA